MIGVNDFIHLPYTSDLTEGGIAYALRSLPYLFDRGDGSSYDRLRRLVAGAAVELAFRRHLSGEDLPYEVKQAAPFTDPDRYDVVLGGQRCELHSFLITHREQVVEMGRNPAVLLNAPALVPSDIHAREDHTDNDLYLFAFLAGRIAPSPNDLKKMVETGEPHYLVHAMDEEWRRPANWNPLGRLALKSESEGELNLEINGLGEGREFMTHTIDLPPKTRVVVDHPFYSITSLHAGRLPDARLGIHREAGRETYLITPLGWGNIRVCGLDIYLAGYLPRGEFSRRAAFIAPGSRVFQYDRTHVKNLSVPVSELRPLGGLFEKARAWDGASF